MEDPLVELLSVIDALVYTSSVGIAGGCVDVTYELSSEVVDTWVLVP